jgi:dihydrofolate reductase
MENQNISIICALTKNRVIGNNEKIPWHIKEDFQLFKEKTEHQITIMGRLTFESIPKKFRPLPNRINIVISRNKVQEQNVLTFNSIANAIEYSKANHPTKEIFLIGGSRIYKEGLSFANHLYLSFIKKDYEGNVYFPEVDFSKYVELESVDFKEFVFKKYKLSN